MVTRSARSKRHAHLSRCFVGCCAYVLATNQAAERRMRSCWTLSGRVNPCRGSLVRGSHTRSENGLGSLGYAHFHEQTGCRGHVDQRIDAK